MEGNTRRDTIRSKKNGTIENEKGMLLFSKLTQLQRRKIMYRIPKGMQYLRECLKDFWKIDLKPSKKVEERIMGSESLWFNHSFSIECFWRDREYFREVIEVELLSDIMDKSTNRIFNRMDWRDWIEELHERKKGIKPTNHFIIDKAIKIANIILQIPKEVKRALRVKEYIPSEDELIGIGRYGRNPSYGYYRPLPRPNIIKVWVDAVGYPHDTDEIMFIGNRTKYKLTLWTGKWPEDIRIVGPQATSFPANTEWKIGNTTTKLDRLTIKKSTRSRLNQKMLPPPAEGEWQSRLMFRKGFVKVWKTSPMYVSPRDALTWFKLKHRNLYVRDRDPTLVDKSCRCCKLVEESMMHLAACRDINDEFWDGVFRLMAKVNIDYNRDEKFLILGLLDEDKITCREGLGILALSWRCLYAEITKAGIEDTEVQLHRPLKRMVAMLIGRVTAYGERWRRWYLSIQHTTKPKKVAEKYQNFKLITSTAEAVYTVNSDLC